ncbi:hypothetical protein O181_019468 [Austropuccinia psidii MF-1]|uniref:Uncharacterized protein n=1 Tax=Austropuccinia psidii MF-1 TaxID=1389203 RepID=A0A9Q3GTM2_9BASI|nr:hypothetical protein [Austropuccinia psidii MF-1]
MSRIGDWGEKAYINLYRRGLASILLDQLASHPGTFDTFQELINITLELETRYHERKKEKGGNQKKKPPVTGSNSSRPPQDSLSKRPHHRIIIRASSFGLQRTSPMLLYLIRTINQLVLKRREELRKGCVLIVVGITQLKNDSRDLRTSLGYQEASLARRENPECES